MEKNNPCRCCLLRPPDRSLKKPYTRSGKTEVYSTMLKECFEIHLTLLADSDCGICEVCVGRLRDASDFKLQVQQSQEELQAWLQGECRIKKEEDSPKPEKSEDYDEDDSQEELISFIAEVKMEVTADPLPMKENDEIKEFLSEEEDSPKPEKSEDYDEDDSQEELINFIAEVKTEVMADSLPMNENDEINEFISDTRNQMSYISKEEPVFDVPLKEERSESPCNKTHSCVLNESVKNGTKHEVKPKKKRNNNIRKKNPSKTYTCDICTKQFVREVGMKIHKRIHAREKLTCDICKKVFSRKFFLENHMQFHTGQKYLACKICGGRFTQSSALRKHELKHSSEKPYNCDICKAQYKAKDSLIAHMSKHTGLKPFRCTLCPLKFTGRLSLRAHIKNVHNGDTCYTCDVCQRSFTDRSDIVRHLNLHFGVKTYTCKLCGLNLSTRNTLRRHNLIHTGDRPYLCETCNKTFRSKHHLEAHKLTHTGERPHCCDICGKQFSQRNNLRKHLEIHVKGVKYACQLCTKSYSTSEGLRQHKRSHLKNKNVPKPRSKKREQKDVN